jgi:hypothetical protein
MKSVSDCTSTVLGFLGVPLPVSGIYRPAPKDFASSLRLSQELPHNSGRRTCRLGEEMNQPVMMPHFESVIGFDPDGVRRIYASTWIEARQDARNYIRNRPDTAPLSAWRFDLVKTPANVMEAASGSA